MRKLFIILLSLIASSYGQTATGGSSTTNATITGPALLQIVTTSLPNCTALNAAYNQTVVGSGGIQPYTWSIQSGQLPTGLGLNSSTGVISGNCTASGTFTFIVLLQDAATPPNSTTQQFTIIVPPAPPPPLDITSTSCPNGTVNVAYTCQLTATGGTPPYAWSISVGSLPSWATLNGSTGLISGTPNVAATTNFTVLVVDSGSPAQTATQALSITINNSNILQITTTSCPRGTINTGYTCQLNASGGTPPYTWSISGGSLPSWASLNTSSGAITGTPNATGTTNFTAQVTDNVNATATQALSITITTPPTTVAQLPQAWADPHECDPVGGVYDNTVTIPSTTYPATLAGLTQVNTDWAAAGDQSWHVVVTAGTIINIASPWTLKPKSIGTGKPTKCLVFESSTPNVKGQTVCSHGAMDPATRNPGCANDLPKMWQLISSSKNSNGSIINVANPDANGNGVNHIVIKDAAMTSTGGGSPLFAIFLEPQSTSGITPSMMCSDMGWERNYFYGDYGDNGTSANNELISTFIKWGCGSSWFNWNYTEGIALGGASPAESHVLTLGQAQPGNMFAQNWIEGGSIPVFFGGAIGASAVAPDPNPTDQEIRQNRFTHNPAWVTPTCLAGPDIKNSGEIKTTARELYTGNIFEQACQGGQHGQAVGMDVRSCSGNVNCDHPGAVITDVNFISNIIRHAGNGIEIDGRSDAGGSGQVASLPMRRVNISNNLMYDIADNASHHGTAPTHFFLNASEDHTWACPTVSRASNVATITCADGGVGLHQTDVGVGDPIEITGCTDTTFNTKSSTISPPGLAGTNGLQANGRTVVYTNAGPAFSSTVETCVLHYIQGWPAQLFISHNTMIGSGLTVRQSTSAGTQDFSLNNTWQDTFFINPSATGTGFVADGQTAGTVSEAYWDVNTLTFQYLDFPFSGSMSNYTSYPSGLTGNQAGSHLWADPAVVCSATTVAGSSPPCTGFAGMMAGAPYLLNSSNPFTDYALVPDSLYKAGGARQASDGTDLGVSFTALQTAETEHKYSGCSTNPLAGNYCGANGNANHIDGPCPY